MDMLTGLDLFLVVFGLECALATLWIFVESARLNYYPPNRLGMSESLRAALHRQSIAARRYDVDAHSECHQLACAVATAEGWPLDRLYNSTGEASHHMPMWVYGE